MPPILISEEDAIEVAKVAKSSEKQSAKSHAIISLFLIVFILGLAAGIIIIAKNVAKKTQGLGQTSVSSDESAKRGLSIYLFCLCQGKWIG